MEIIFPFLSEILQLLIGHFQLLVSNFHLLSGIFHSFNSRFVAVLISYYGVATYGSSHSCWRVCLGMLAHIFWQIKRHCRLACVKSEPNEMQTEKIEHLRKLHQHSCDLLRDFNEIYSLQILASLTHLFVLLAFRCSSTIMYIPDLELNGVVLYDLLTIVFFVYTLLTIIIAAHFCILQVLRLCTGYRNEDSERLLCCKLVAPLNNHRSLAIILLNLGDRFVYKILQIYFLNGTTVCFGVIQYYVCYWTFANLKKN